jgi:hypothetical protein
MEIDKIHYFVWATIVSALATIYGIFLKHVIGHVDKKEIEKLWEEKQDTKTCDKIVERIDQNHAETCKKLDRILDEIRK